MTSRARVVGVALLAVLAIASACPAAELGSAPGRGGIGGQIGASSFALGDYGDYSAGAEPRFAFGAHWRYAFTSHIRWQISPGFTWSGYSEGEPVPFTDPNFPSDTDKKQYLTLMLPASAQLQLTMRRGPWIYYLGAGPGAYRVWIENRRKVLEDPVSHKLHRGIYPGGTAQIGFERFLKSMPNVSLEISSAGHLVFAKRDEQFPSGFSGQIGALEIRVGGNYYFTPGIKRKPESTLPGISK